MPRIERHRVLHRAMIHEVKPGQQARARRAAGDAGGDMVAEGHALAAKPVQIGRAQEIRAEGGDEIGPPLIHDDQQNIATRSHGLSRTLRRRRLALA